MDGVQLAETFGRTMASENMVDAVATHTVVVVFAPGSLMDSKLCVTLNKSTLIRWGSTCCTNICIRANTPVPPEHNDPDAWLVTGSLVDEASTWALASFALTTWGAMGVCDGYTPADELRSPPGDTS